MRKIVIAGGPHTGKSTLLNRLRQEYSDEIYFVPEPATLIIDAENKKQATETGYEGIFPTNRYREFARLAVAKSVELEDAIPTNVDVAILDRCLIDNVGYARLNGCYDLLPHMRALAKAANYSVGLMCDFVGRYQQTDIRIVDEAEAHRIHEHLLEAYSEFDLDIVHLPSVNLESRVAIARAVIKRMQA